MIAWTIRETSLGRLLVAATPRGVCFSAFGEDDAALEALLAAEFPYAATRRDDAGLAAWSDRLVAGVDGDGARGEVPLDVAGSRFQRRVWDALRAIPRGQTRAYGEIAAALGAPRAARAVARACAQNHVPVAIPCHRVVPRQGGTGGYAFGAWRKRALLAREAAPAPDAADSDGDVLQETKKLSRGPRARAIHEAHPHRGRSPGTAPPG